MVGRQKCSCSCSSLVRWIETCKYKFQSGFSSLFSKLASLFSFIRLLSRHFQLLKSRIVVWRSSDVPPFCVVWKFLRFWLRWRSSRERLYLSGALCICWKIFSCCLSYSERGPRNTLMSVNLCYAVFFFSFGSMSLYYITSAFGAKVEIFFTVIIIIRYLPEFLSIIAAFLICSSNWWLFLRLLKIINISNTSQ